MSEQRWWLEPVDPEDPAVKDGPVADLDEPSESEDRVGHLPRLDGEPVTDG